MDTNAKSWRHVITISLALVGFYAALNAATKKVNTPSGTVPPEIDQTTVQGFVTSDIEGVVQSLDRDATTSRVRIRDDRGQISELTIDNDAAIFRDGDPVTVARVQAGDRVMISPTSHRP